MPKTALRAGVRAFARDRDGAKLPIVGVALTVLIGAGALAVDVSRLYAARGDLQAAADVAARSAAWEIPDADAVAELAGTYASQTMDPARNGTVLAPGDVTLGAWDYRARSFTAGAPVANAVHLRTRRDGQNDNPVQLAFGAMLGDSLSDVRAEAIATKIDITACVLSLADGGTGLEFNGGITVDSPQCGFAANSLSPDAALIANGSSGSVEIESLYLAGGMDDPHGVIQSTEPPIVKARRQIDDPYADRDFSSLPTDASLTANVKSKPNSPVSLEPGVYSDGYDFKGEVDLAPGVYVMEGDVSVRSQAQVTGTDATIVLNNGDIDVSGGATLDFDAPDSGPTAGIAVMRQGGPSSSKMSGGSGMQVEGAIYMPNSDLSYSGNSTPGRCLQVIAHRVTLSGDAGFGNDCRAIGGEDITMAFTMLVD